jgi:hypothetical protein
MPVIRWQDPEWISLNIQRTNLNRALGIWVDGEVNIILRKERKGDSGDMLEQALKETGLESSCHVISKAWRGNKDRIRHRFFGKQPVSSCPNHATQTLIKHILTDGYRRVA